MNDASGKTTSSSCLAITEKKNQGLGGCTGLFFQLFDWNGKLAKKKLFSKKLLPNARPKQAKKFKGDEKMPSSKLHLIANENKGGFPSSKKGGNRGLGVEQKHEMRAPGLIARLMGLESIPASQRDKSNKKASFSATCNRKDESPGNHCEPDGPVENLEMRIARHDSRPQKLQKTGAYERKTVARFGAEALQIKSVFSRAKKYNSIYHHPPKIASHLKSPRITSGKNMSRSSRLIGAATKILEPGLQATSRAKCSLTYSSSMYPSKNNAATDQVGTLSANLQNQSGYDANAAKPLMGSMGQTSCKSCGNLLDVVDCNMDAEGQPTVHPPIISEVISTSPSAQRKVRSLMNFHGQERDVVLLRPQRQLASTVEEDGRNYTVSCHEPTTRKMPLPGECPSQWTSLHQCCRTVEDDASSVAFKCKAQTEEQILSSERTSPGSKVSRSKNFVALNRSQSGQTRLRSPTKMDTSKFDLERKPCRRQDDSLTHVRTMERKRRIPSVTQVESTASVNSAILRQRNSRSDAQSGKGKDISAYSINSTNNKCKQGSRGKTYYLNDNKVNGVVSFAFNSPLKQRTGITAEKEEISGPSEMNPYFQTPVHMGEEALGAFLEQKLRELTSQGDEKLAIGSRPKRSPAMILQELISALSAANLTCHDDHRVNADEGFHDVREKGRLVGASCNSDRLSPGSVLGASFSSSSLDESSGHDLQPESMNYSYDQLEHDAELLDSVTSLNKRKIVTKVLPEIVNQISRILQSLSSFGARLTRSKLTHVKDVILNAELLLGSTATMHSEVGVSHLFISRFLLYELDAMLVDAMLTDFTGFVGCKDSKERNQLKRFLFDCVIEYLESNCCKYCNCGFRTWTRLPLCMNSGMVVQEVKRVIKKWASIAGMIPDEMIEWEMSHSGETWIDFEIEAFEAGVAINEEILQILVHEIVEELEDCIGASFESIPRSSY
ncbi:uncharacterized protein G2W53_032245 [Senna tora]|uniref:DUF4378 domain-containing protein n=1 Tax=Senna tora TaxID=362788 RepID=A0A834SWD1_9FABA|nr:uncharacterized protein G2W53_032245 [Senna tora]